MINGWGTAEAASVLLYVQLDVAEADALRWRCRPG
jgi:hypothetical protein